MSGFKYNKYDHNFNRTFRKTHNKLYPIYESIKPDLKSLSLQMLEIEQEFLIMEKENLKLKDIDMISSDLYDLTLESDNIKLELDQTINICKKIIRKYIGDDGVEYFEKMIDYDQIIVYNADSASLRAKYDAGTGSMYDYEINRIYIPLNNNIDDIYSICHEFIHAISLDSNYIMSSELLGEVGPIFMEFLVLEYLSLATGNNPICYNNFIERIINNYGINYIINNKEGCEDSIYIYEYYSYDIGILLAFNMYKKYLQNKERYLINFKRFIINIGNLHFNTIIKLLGINIKYIDDKLRYDDDLMEILINSYKEYVKMIEINDLSIIKNNKVKIKG